MKDVNELIEQLRDPVNSQWPGADLLRFAADALEAEHAEVELCDRALGGIRLFAADQRERAERAEAALRATDDFRIADWLKLEAERDDAEAERDALRKKLDAVRADASEARAIRQGWRTDYEGCWRNHVACLASRVLATIDAVEQED